MASESDDYESREEGSSEAGCRENDAGESDSDDDFDDTAYGTMARFVPTLVLERLRAEGEAAVSNTPTSTPVPTASLPATNPTEGLNNPQVHELDAAVMVVDVSGFSGMCEQFAQGFVPDGGWGERMQGIPSLHGGSGGIRRQGAPHASVIARLYRHVNENETKGFGAEGVRDVLNAALGALISSVERHGGDVLRVAGDALIVLFHQGRSNISPAEMTDLCSACTRCGWECAASGELGLGDGSPCSSRLSVHVGVGCGKVSCFHVGSNQRGWQLVVSGSLFEEQKCIAALHMDTCYNAKEKDLRKVAKALNASSAGEVVVSARVWQRLVGTGWESISKEDKEGDLSGLRLIQCIPDLAGVLSGGIGGEFSGPTFGGTIATTGPAHGGGGALALPVPARCVTRRASHTGGGKPGSAHPANAPPMARMSSATNTPNLAQAAIIRRHSRAVSLDQVPMPRGGSFRPRGRWSPSRRRLALLEEVETGLLTMLSKEVVLALKGYCPQPIREGLVAERLELLAEIQRVAVLFIGLSFDGRGIQTPSAPAPSSSLHGGKPGRKTLSPPTLEANGQKSSVAEVLLSGHGQRQPTATGEGYGKQEDKEARSPMDGSDEARSALELLQSSFALLQDIVAGHHGLIKELSVDDKGTVLVVGFGLSPHVGQLPAARATLCAMESTDRLRALGLAKCYAGVAMGPVFCGSLGSANRREFAMVSETVNLAQRLMSARTDRRLLPKNKIPAPNPEHSGPASQQLRLSPNRSSTSQEGGDRSSADRRVGAPHGFPHSLKTSSPSNMTTSPRAASDSTLPLDTVNTTKFPGSPSGGVWPWKETKSVSQAIRHWNTKSKASQQNGSSATPPHRNLRSSTCSPKQQHAIPESWESNATDKPRVHKKFVPHTPGSHEASPVRSQVAGLRGTASLGGRPSELHERSPVRGGTSGMHEKSPRAGAECDDEWDDSANRWVVVESETCREAGKTDQLSFFELEAIKVKGKESKVAVFAPCLTNNPPTPPRGQGVVRGGANIISPPATNSHHLTTKGVASTQKQGNDCGVNDASARYRLKVRAKWGDSGDGSVSSSVGNGSRDKGSSIRGNGHEDTTTQRSSNEPNLHGGRGVPKEDPMSADLTDIGLLPEPSLFRSISLPIPSSRAKNLQGEDRARRALGGNNVSSCRFAREVTPSTSTNTSSPGRPEIGRAVSSGGSREGDGRAGGGTGGGLRAVGGGGGDVLSREAFEMLLPCIFHANAVHDEVSHILWARTGGKVSYLSDLCKCLLGTDGQWLNSTGGNGCEGLGEVGEDGTWRLTLNEFAHVLKLASRVPQGVDEALQEKLSPFTYSPPQVVLRAVCVCVVAGVGDMELLLHLLTNVVPFKEYWATVVSSKSTSPIRSRRRRRRILSPPRSAAKIVDTKRGCLRRGDGVAGAGMVGRNGGGSMSGDGPNHRALRTDSLEGDGTEEEAAQSPGRIALLSCLRELETAGLLKVCEKEKTFICSDVMLIDQVYSSTPFKLRKGLHKEAAKWLCQRHCSSFGDRAEVMPVLISHLTQAHEEARAQAMLAVLKVLGGQFLDRWVLKRVTPLVGIREYPGNPQASEHLALCILPAIPSLRGLAKAMRGAEIAGVVVGVALRLRSLRFKNPDRLGSSSRHSRNLSMSSSGRSTLARASSSSGDPLIEGEDTDGSSSSNSASKGYTRDGARHSMSLAAGSLPPLPDDLVAVRDDSDTKSDDGEHVLE